jgi:multidrug efflux system membrane fusion protein
VRSPETRAASWLRTRLAILAAFVGLLAAGGCSKEHDPVRAPAAVPVTVATVVQKTVPIQVRAIGNVEAYSSVSIKAQISGELTAVHFREGEDVHKGQLLFTIDPRPFEAALQQAQANLARDKANAENARVQAARYAKLFEEGVAPREQYDQMRTSADALDAAVRAGQAAIEKAKLDLQYCTIYSPIDGRTGSLMVHPGNLTKANDVPILLVINQLNPIYADFSLAQQYLADVKKYMAGGKLKVEAILPGDPQHPELGTVSFVDNAVDSTTGTIRLKATFANQQQRLWPGQFVDVVFTLTERPKAIVVPAQALQTGQNGQYVFVVKADNTVESRPVVAGSTVRGETIVEKGLQLGETVVTDGQLRLAPGSRVEVKASPEASQVVSQDTRS